MNFLMAAWEGLFEWTWKTSGRASVLILLMLLLQRLLGRRLTAGSRYAFSFLVLIALLLPIAPASRLSLENLFPASARFWKQTPASALPISPAIHSQAVGSEADLPDHSPIDANHGLSMMQAASLAWFSGTLGL